jgi:putative ABC transport system permease protein
VRDGDDASCLNLNRAQQPKLLGVKPGLLHNQKAFSFVNEFQWMNLSMSNAMDMHANSILGVGDAASIQWALHKKIGDALSYRDERGNDFDVRLVGGLANSILQGSIIIDEAEFTRRFPSVSGYRMFLIDCPSNALPQVSAELSRALQDYGFEVTPTAQRLAAFNAVQNTYLNTFQVLGGLGLLLGSVGLGIVVLRNVLERRGELALLIAVGFRRARVQKLVLAEHAALLGLGLAIGILSALVAILPSLLSPRGELPVRSLALTLGGVLLFGLISTWLATRVAVRGNLLEGLRNE